MILPFDAPVPFDSPLFTFDGVALPRGLGYEVFRAQPVPPTYLTGRKKPGETGCGRAGRRH